MSNPGNGRLVISARSLRRVAANALWLTLVVAGLAALSPGQAGVNVKAYSSAEAGRITMGPDGALWFTETNAGKIGRITTSGVITEYAIPTANSFPFGITTGPDGALWFTEVQSQKIGRMTTDGTVTEYPAGGSPSNDFLSNIAAGADGALWFNKHCSGISRITTAGVVTDYPTTSCPFGLTRGPDDALWFADLYRVGRMTTDGVVTSYPLDNYGLQAITVGPDKALWFTGSLLKPPRATDPMIGRITTAGAITKYFLAEDQGWSYLIASGSDGALWFTNPYDNYSVGRITTGGVISIVPIGGPCRYPYNPFNGIVRGDDGALWLSCSSGGIVQLTVADTTPPAVRMKASPNVLWPPNQKMVTVIVSGSITDAGSGVLSSSVEYAVTDEYKVIEPRGHLTLDAAGNYAFTLSLRASREGFDSNGRVYMIRVSARDNVGNRGANWRAVVVPHDLR